CSPLVSATFPYTTLFRSAVRVIRRRVEGQVRQGVLLAPLPDRLHARLLVEGFVAALLRGAVDDEIRVPHEIVEDARGLHARLLRSEEHTSELQSPDHLVC